MRIVLLILFICSCCDGSVLEKAQKIKLVALDVDGVMTNGEISYSSLGEEIKTFNVKDGLGLVLLAENEFITVIITGRESSIVERRGKELKVRHIYQNVKNKQRVIRELADEYTLDFEQICYIGDDLPDLPALRITGLACCPSDAVRQVKEACHWVSKHRGGHGAVRELADLLLESQDYLLEKRRNL